MGKNASMKGEHRSNEMMPYRFELAPACRAGLQTAVGQAAAQTLCEERKKGPTMSAALEIAPNDGEGVAKIEIPQSQACHSEHGSKGSTGHVCSPMMSTSETATATSSEPNRPQRCIAVHTTSKLSVFPNKSSKPRRQRTAAGSWPGTISSSANT